MPTTAHVAQALMRWSLLVAFSVPPCNAQLPPASPFTRASTAPAGRGQPHGGQVPASAQQPLQLAIDGIAGLMQRFESLQPRMGQIKPVEFQRIAATSQQLHERFLELQERLRRVADKVPASDEQRVLKFHSDLEAFVASVDAQLGIAGSQPPAGLKAAPTGGASPHVYAQSVPSRGAAISPQLPEGTRASLGGGMSASPPTVQAPPVTRPSDVVTPTTDRRLQKTMNDIVNGMRRFEDLHPQLRSMPVPAYQSIASRAQQLHEKFVALQRRGTELTGSGNIAMRETDAVLYASQMENFVREQTELINDAQGQVDKAQFGAMNSHEGGYAQGGNTFGYRGMLGQVLTVPKPSSSALHGFQGENSDYGQAPTPVRSTSNSLHSGGRLNTMSGIVTPTTDRRLSAVIKKVVDQMQEFESMKQRIQQLPPQILQNIAAQGERLHQRFVALQQRGAAIAGDGTNPMQESDASLYADDMESFYQEQSAYVTHAKEALHNGPGKFAGSQFTNGLNSATSGNGFGYSAASSGPTLGSFHGSFSGRDFSAQGYCSFQ